MLGVSLPLTDEQAYACGRQSDGHNDEAEDVVWVARYLVLSISVLGDSDLKARARSQSSTQASSEACQRTHILREGAY